MRLSEHLCRECLIADLAAADKDQALAEIAAAAKNTGLDPQTVLSVLLERESLGSTAVGNGYAIPHGKMHALPKMLLIFARSAKGVDFGAPDGKPCHFFFTVLAPANAAGQHLALLGTIARLAKDASFATGLRQAQNAAELMEFLAAA